MSEQHSVALGIDRAGELLSARFRLDTRAQLICHRATWE